ncbi:hypothetical protein CTAYLR_003590 [Chrysophaeum taylorii]|uniref:Arginine biosynthesis bifunctional protein ArgJ, mitochondrial n=1 Tax=Chrysophaeum taylorii TaxID=2483200 RepID=A0AAD7XM62_9STRA|nr:hypothetical protein CTAYLR_003590 [Chrysophaeum taylorii]
MLLLLVGSALGLRAAWMGCEVRDWAASQSEWEALMWERGRLPEGFRAWTTSLEFTPRELESSGVVARMNVGAVVSEREVVAAGVYTSNLLVGAPVSIGRRAMRSREAVRGVCVNNKVSNVRPSSGLGEEDALRVCEAYASALGAGTLLPASTGVIGWALPVSEMIEATSRLREHDSAAAVAAAMMTTDRYPKVARVELEGGGTIVGIAKGAGMLEPELCATMLAFIATDVAIDRAELSAALERVAKRTFSCVGVDGDESTSDMVVCMSSGVVKSKTGADFEDGLGDVAAQLAHHLVRNGEGTNHVVRLAMRSPLDPEEERKVAREVLNGPLFKCAVAGNDPNVGRLVGKIGQVLSRRGHGELPSFVRLGGEVIFENGSFSLEGKEARIAAHLKEAQLGDPEIGLPGKSHGLAYPAHGRCVEIEIEYASAPPDRPPTVVLGSDLTHQYVTENADYRS